MGSVPWSELVIGDKDRITDLVVIPAMFFKMSGTVHKQVQHQQYVPTCHFPFIFMQFYLISMNCPDIFFSIDSDDISFTFRKLSTMVL